MRFLFSGIYYERARNGKRTSEPDIGRDQRIPCGNLCRCTGYMGQLRAIKKYIEVKNAEKKGGKEE